MSEFTLDIQLTELGFSSWNFPLCEPQSVKETFLPTPNSIEKPAAETEIPGDCHEDACIVPSASAEKSFLLDHQYSSPFKQDSSPKEDTAQGISKAISTDKKEKVICTLWKRERKETEQTNNDEVRSEQKKSDKEQSSPEVNLEASCVTTDDVISGEERTDEEVEFVLTDDDVDEEEEDDVEEEEEDDDDVSWPGIV